LLAARSLRTRLALPSGGRDQLPAVARARAGIICPRDEAGAVQRDDVEVLVALVVAVRATDRRRGRIAAGQRDRNPVGVRRLLRRILARLPCAAITEDDVARIGDVVFGPRTDARQLAGLALLAPIAALAPIALRTGLSV
jgi:hypothetical protein